VNQSSSLSAWISGGEVRPLLGHRIFVRTAVAAGRPPLLLIHGYPTASYDWHLLWDSLATRYSLYCLDLLGFGSSEKPRGHRYSISGQADLCSALLDAHAVRRTHVLAHDYGDTVAQELLARERDERIVLGSVAFLNGGLFPETHRARPVQKLLAAPVIGALLARTMSYARFASAMRSIAGINPPADDELRDLWSLIEASDGRVALARLIGYMEERRRNRPRWVGALTATTVPLQLICGTADPVSGAHLAARYRELVPRADVTLLDGVGHYPQLEAPGLVLEAYLRFRHATR
jgi:pimeloyl-ACP methyl ester carboxylesterase